MKKPEHKEIKYGTSHLSLAGGLAFRAGRETAGKERLISFRAEGDAEIIATDNCNLMEQTPYSAHGVPAWHGKASVVFRRTGDGAFRIIAETDELESALWEAEEMDE